MAIRTICTPWRLEQRARTLHTRSCSNGGRVDVVQGDGYYTYNLYMDGKYVDRASANTMKAAKAKASSALRRLR